MKTSLFSTLFFSLLISSCTKEHPHHHLRNISPSAQNITGTYNLVGLSLVTGSNVEQDLFTSLDACAQDNMYTLRPGGSFTHTDAGMLCNPTKEETSTWAMQEQRGIRLGVTVYEIQQFNGMRMALISDTVVNGEHCKLVKKLLRR